MSKLLALIIPLILPFSFCHVCYGADVGTDCLMYGDTVFSSDNSIYNIDYFVQDSLGRTLYHRDNYNLNVYAFDNYGCRIYWAYYTIMGTDTTYKRIYRFANEYDSLSRATRITQTRNDTTNLVIDISYDGNKSTFIYNYPTYDTTLIDIMTKDSMDSVIEVISLGEDSSLISILRKNYDENGKLIKQSMYNGDSTLDYERTYEYDLSGKLTLYKEFGSLLELTYRIIFEYGPDNKLLSQSHFDGSGNMLGTDTCFYNMDGRLALQNSYLNGDLAFIYHYFYDSCISAMEPFPNDGSFSISDVSIIPNPFNPQTLISFPNLTRKADVIIYSINGQLIKSFKSIRNNQVKWDASDQPSGIYLVNVNTSNKVLIKRLILIK